MRLRAGALAVGLVAALLLTVLSHTPAQTLTQTQVVLTYVPQVDVFRTPSLAFTLSAAPAANTRTLVYVNGLLMLEGEDYVLTARDLSFIAHVDQMDNPIVQVHYWRLQP